MGKPKKKLFKCGEPDNRGRNYHFTKLNGEEGYYPLGSREVLWKKCPICENYIISGYDQMDKWIHCPSCDMNTSGMTLEKYLEIIKENYKRHLEKQKELSRIIENDLELIKIVKKKIIKENYEK